MMLGTVPFNGVSPTQTIDQFTIKPSDPILLYDRFHNLIDEITMYGGLSYTKTLNGIGQAQFVVGIESNKATPENLKFFNHVEIYKGGHLEWAGIIVMLSFDDPAIHVGCYGYMQLLKKRRCREKTYPTLTYGNLLSEMLSETNLIEDTGITVGSIATGSLETTRKVRNTDYILDKMLDFIDDGNYNLEIDDNRKLNFYIRKGSVKPYLAEYGGDNDNIIVKPRVDMNTLEMANSVFAEIDNESGIMSSWMEDTGSQAIYGLLEGTYSANDSIVLQDTLDAYVASELQRRSYPIQSINLSIVDSTMCPFDDIYVGDSITVSLLPYWRFKQQLRILEIKHNEDTGVRDLVVGSILFRQQKPVKKLYKGG